MRRKLLLLPLALAAAQPAQALNCSLKPGITADQAAAGLCGYDVTARHFAGTPAEQAACLTRKVRKGGILGPSSLTSFLRNHVGRDTGTTPEKLSNYLTNLGIDPARELGGDPVAPVTATYFIIHDTSEPNCSHPGWSPT